MKQEVHLQAGEVYALQEKETGKWFAFQILEIGKENVAYVDLDYWSERMPEASDLDKMSYLRLNHHIWNNKISHCWAPIEFFPSHAIKIGSMAIRPFEECKSYANWTNGSHQKWQEKWDKLPKDQVKAFKEAKWNETVVIANKEVGKSLLGLSDDMLDAVSDFSEFDKLPRLGRITTTKDYPQLIPFLEHRYLIHELVWDNCQKRELDLSRTHLEELVISGKNVEIINLPSSISNLTLRGELSPDLRIYSPNDGYSMVLWVEMKDDFLPNVGLRRLTNLCLTHIQNFNLQSIPSIFPGLMWFRLAGKPGYIRNLAEISKLHELETLTMDDLFGFSADDFPRPESFPGLRHLWIKSIPDDAGKIIKKLYKGKIQDLSVSKLRSDEWLHENLNNPLRHWDGSEFVPKSKYTKAVALWKEARRRILEEANHADIDSATIKNVAIDYIEGFNRLDRRSQFIETKEREDIIHAFEQILDEAGYDKGKEEILQIMDEKRNW